MTERTEAMSDVAWQDYQSICDENERLRMQNYALRTALIACKRGAEYPDELGDFINAALAEKDKT